MKARFFILFLVFCAVPAFPQKEYVISNLESPEPVYGEENAPETIYYKYVRNNTSEFFLYTQIEIKNIWDRDALFIFFVSIENNDGVLLMHFENWIYQFSIIYNLRNIEPFIYDVIYDIKYKLDSISRERAYRFLVGQFDYQYRLIHREALEALLEETLPPDGAVLIDNFLLSAPRYVRERAITASVEAGEE